MQTPTAYLKPFYWAGKDWPSENGPKFSIFAFCHSYADLLTAKATGEKPRHTIALHIDDYEPWIHLVLPENIPKGCEMAACKQVFEQLKKKLEKDDHAPIRYEVASRLPLYYYTVDERICMKVHFRTEDAARHCGNLMKWPVWTQYGKLEILHCEDRIDQLAKFHGDLQLRTCDWIEVTGIKVPFHDKTHRSKLPTEIECSWRSVKTCEPKLQDELGNSYPSYMVFDGEMMSHRKFAFPDELNANDPIFMWGVLHIHWVDSLPPWSSTPGLPGYTVDEYCLVYHKEIKMEQIRPIPKSKLVSKKVSGEVKYDVLEDQGEVKLMWYHDEIDMEVGLDNLINELDPDGLIGHNSNSFDLPYRKVRRARLHEPYLNISRMRDWIQGWEHIEWSSSAYRDIELDVPDGYGRIWFDTMLMAKRDYKFDSFGLDAMCQELMGIGKHDHGPEKIFESFRQNDPEKLRDTIVYCMRDVWCTWGLFSHLNFWISYSGMSNVIGVAIFDLFAEGQGIRTRTQVFKECLRRGYYLHSPERVQRSIAGGHVFPQNRGLYEWMWLFDFAGLYPSIMRAYNISNDTFDFYKRAPDDKCHIFKWTDQFGDWETRFVKPELRKGIIPAILEYLAKSRSESKKKMADCAKNGDTVGEMINNVEQNAKKVSMNSIYGGLAQKGGYLGLEEAGATITAVGRQLVQTAAKWLDERGYDIVYGDSVTGSTPVLVRYKIGDPDEGCPTKIENLFSSIRSPQLIDLTGQEKTYKLVQGVEAWTEQGWTAITFIMKHKTTKRIFGVHTKSGYVQVTEDHSMLLEDGTPISPKELKLGDKLLQSHPSIELGSAEVTEIAEIPYDGEVDVYDLTTANHHFQAGIGGIIVHNTDSVMVRRRAPLSDDEKRNFKAVGDAVLKQLNEECFKPPIMMEHDGQFRTFMTIAKKMYSFVSWDPKNPLGINPDYLKSKGLVTARHDSCKMIRKVYKETNRMIVTLKPVEDVIIYVAEEIERLLKGVVTVEELVSIKQMGSDYASENNPLAIFSKHLISIGQNPKPGDRIPFVFRKKKGAKHAGDSYEDPEVFVREGYEFDRFMYLESQFANKLDLLLHVAYPTLYPPKLLCELRSYLGMRPNLSVLEVMVSLMIAHQKELAKEAVKKERTEVATATVE